MAFLLLFLVGICACCANEIQFAPELSGNKLKFPWGINFKDNGVLHHNIDRMWIVTKIQMPRWEDVNFRPLLADVNCDRHLSPDLRKALEISNESRRSWSLPVQPTGTTNRSGGTHQYWLYSICKSIEPVLKVSLYLQCRRQDKTKKAMHAMNHKSDQMIKNMVSQFDEDFLMYGRYDVGTLNKAFTTLQELQRNQTALARMVLGDQPLYKSYHGDTLYAMHLVEYALMARVKHYDIYADILKGVESFFSALHQLSMGYLPKEIFDTPRLVNITDTVKHMLCEKHPEYTLAIDQVQQYYDMKLVTFSLDPNDRTLVVTFPVFLKHINRKPMQLYQIETVAVPVPDLNPDAESSTLVQTSKPYIAVSDDYYIQIRTVELRMCKVISHKHYCEEVFVVKHKSKFSCESALFFDLDPEVVMRQCSFKLIFNETQPPQVLDGGNYLILANMGADKRLICREHADLAAPLPPASYAMVHRSILCYCDLDAGLAYVLQTLGACNASTVQLTLHFTVNNAFYYALTPLWDRLGFEPPSAPTEDVVYPVALSDYYQDNDTVLPIPSELKAMAQFVRLRQPFSSSKTAGEKDDNEHQNDENFWNHPIVTVFQTISAFTTVLLIVWLMYLACKQLKLKSLIQAGIMMKTVTPSDATANLLQQAEDIWPTRFVCQDPWVSIFFTTITIVGMIVYFYKNVDFKALIHGYQYTNRCNVYLIVSKGPFYVPIRITETTGILQNFKLTAELSSEQVTLANNSLWDILHIDWQEVRVLYDDSIVHLPSEVPIPLVDKYRVRRKMNQEISLHVMIKQGKNWYGLNGEIQQSTAAPLQSVESAV